MRIVRAIVAIMLVMAIIFFVVATIHLQSPEMQKKCVKVMFGLLMLLVVVDYNCKDSGFKDSDYHGE